MFDIFFTIWPYLYALVYFGVAVATSTHVLLTKRDVRAAIGWTGIIWLTPFLGSLLYVLFGVNRIERRAQLLRGSLPDIGSSADTIVPAERIAAELGGEADNLKQLIRYMDGVTEFPLLSGNLIEPLRGGDICYPAMIEAIESAEHSVALCSYIFDNDRAGAMFLEALVGAMERGVEVRVLIDGVGSRYSWPSMVRRLRDAKVNVARFMPTLFPGRLRYANLRCHRKIMVVDGKIGFTGGMNIREGCLLELSTHHPVDDLHFRLQGPIVADLQRTFAEDWSFSTGELLAGDSWFPALEDAGPAYARGVSDGPDEDFDKSRLTMLGALGCARHTVQIVTPYFLPDQTIITAINVACLRGVAIDLVLPDANNLKLVGWAMNATLPQVLRHGLRVWLQPPPFDHTKLVLVDEAWSLLGSANWDPRSLRLNFEFNVECYDRGLAQTLKAVVDEKIAAAKRTTFEQLENRHIVWKLRDNIARLFSPYL